jgi:hypothetical protein
MAIDEFQKTVSIGRRLFPKRIRKDNCWSDVDTRPFIRGIENLALTLNSAGRYDEAVAYRGAIHLNQGDWDRATESARDP